MCYDMSFFSNIKLVTDYLGMGASPLQFEPTYHRVAQSFGRWPVVTNDGGWKVELFEWGLIADYMNTPEKIQEYRTSMANARSEKLLDDTRSVWHRLRRQRCLVMTTGFFEHQDTGGKKKQPFFIRLKDQELFCMAGLYNYSPLPDPETGEVKGTFTVITREGNEKMKEIHNGGPNSGRMPLILTKELALEWLNPGLNDEGIRKIAHYECPSDALDTWPVNTIRTRKADDASVIARSVPKGLFD
jgi:putative SOS response-associated peptidase YedK